MRRKPFTSLGLRGLPFRIGSSTAGKGAAAAATADPSKQQPSVSQLPGKPDPKGDGTPTDPNFVDSERTPAQEGLQPETNDDRTQRLVALVDGRFLASYDSRRVAEKNYQESLAFYRGDQWVEYNAATGVLRSTREAGNPNRVWSVHNKLRPVAFHIIARGLSVSATASFRPKTRRLKDRLATRQMRSVWEHVQQVNNWESLWLDLMTQAVIVGPAYCYTYYNTQDVVEVPVFAKGSEADPDPEIDDIIEAPLGEIRLDFLSTFEVYPDPKARRWEDVSYLTIARRIDLETIKARWPKQGKFVQPESGGPGETVALTNDAITQQQMSRGHATGRHTAILKIHWEKPSPAYPPRPDEKVKETVKDPVTGKEHAVERIVKHPGGRYIVTAGGRLLDEREWLYPWMKDFPVVPLPYRKGVETVWGDNALSAAIGPQRDYNRANSKVQERPKSGDGKLLVARGSEISHKEFKIGAPNEVVYWTHSDPRMPNLPLPAPQYLPPPVLDPSIIRAMEIADENVKAITSVNDPTLGQTKGDLSGVALNALQDGDQSEGSLFRQHQQTAVKQIAANVGALARQFYLKDEARLLYVQDTAPPKKPPIPVLPHPNAGPSGPGGPMPQGAPMPPGGPVGAPGHMGGTNGVSQQSTQGQQGPHGPQSGGLGDDSEDEDPSDSPRMQAMVFRHLPEGRWVVDATAAASVSPSARRQVILQMAQAHMFDPPQLPATIVLLNAMELLGDDNVIDDLRAALQMQMDAQAANAAASASQPPPDPIQQARIEAVVQTILAHVKMNARQAEIDAETAAKIQIMQAERTMPPKPPTIALAGKLTPSGELAAEEAGGLDVHGAAGHLHDAASIAALPGAPVDGAAPYGMPPSAVPIAPAPPQPPQQQPGIGMPAQGGPQDDTGPP